MDGVSVSKGDQQGQNLYQPDPDQVVQPDAAEATPVSLPSSQTPSQPNGQPYNTNRDTITWTASEFIAHQKSGKWYVLFVLGAIGTAVVVWLLTRDFFVSTAVAIGVGLLGYYAAKQPHEQTYTLDASGLTIGSRHHKYNEFRSFSATPEGVFLSIELTPLKRVAMYTTMYVDPSDEDRILNLLSQHLPMEEARNNFADSFMRRIHF